MCSICGAEKKAPNSKCQSAECIFARRSDAASKESSDNVSGAVCSVCKSGDREDRLICCDHCQSGYHIDCINLSLDDLPGGAWFCHHCQGGSARPSSHRDSAKISVQQRHQKEAAQQGFGRYGSNGSVSGLSAAIQRLAAVPKNDSE